MARKVRKTGTGKQTPNVEVAYEGRINPPLSTETSYVQRAPLVTILRDFGSVWFLSLVGGGLVWLVGDYFDLGWLRITGISLGVLTAIGLTWLISGAQVAVCPYCGKKTGRGVRSHITLKDNREQIECEKCHEWLISNKGMVRAFNEEDARRRTRFSAPLYWNAVWPGECIVCGRPPTRRLKAPGVGGASLARLKVGALAAAAFAVNNVPYCAAHEDAVRLGKQDEYLRLIFPNLAMMRRYLAGNSEGNRRLVKAK